MHNIQWSSYLQNTTFSGIPLSKIPKKQAPNEPDNKGNKESCLTMNFNGELADLSCEETRPYVCYRSGDSKQRVNECGTTDLGKCRKERQTGGLKVQSYRRSRSLSFSFQLPRCVLHVRSPYGKKHLYGLQVVVLDLAVCVCDFLRL